MATLLFLEPFRVFRSSAEQGVLNFSVTNEDYPKENVRGANLRIQAISRVIQAGGSAALTAGTAQSATPLPCAAPGALKAAICQKKSRRWKGGEKCAARRT